MYIGERYEILFIEVGTDSDHVHFLIHSVLTMAISKIVQIIKSITVQEVYRNNSEVKKELWGGNFWISGFYAKIVS